MDTRRAKQAIYGTLYFIIWIGIFTGIYFSFIKTPPSCFDNVQNQGELGVDCGGPCVKVCIPADLAKITPVTISIFPSGPNHYTFLAQVENANPGFAAQNFDYTFTIYDASGTVIDAIPGQSFLYAGEVKYLLIPNLALAQIPANAKIAVASANWVPEVTLGVVPAFRLQNLGAGTPASSTISVNGTITDNDTAGFTDVLVIAVFEDATNHPIGASQTILNSIVPGQTENFSIMYPADPSINPSLTQLYAYALR